LIKSLADPDGNSLVHKTGKFSYNYVLTLFIVEANTQLIATSPPTSSSPGSRPGSAGSRPPTTGP
jgi:hypothetical protein